jgi:serine phosphatase RsbU (regulator of sigma subunit)/anti-sigma regulatory factor (Ser/Thr protein kinase)
MSAADDDADVDDIAVPPEFALETLSLALEGTSTGAWHWNVVDDTVRWSAGQGPLHGMARGTAPDGYAAWLRSVHDDDREQVQATIEHGLAEGHTYECEFRTGSGDGRWLHSRGRVLRDDAGRVLSVVGVTVDVTERRSREAELEQLTQRLRSLQALTDVALAHLELDALLDELLARVAELLRADTAIVLLHDASRRALHVAASRGIAADEARGLRVPLGEGFAGRVVASARPLIVADTADEDLVLDHLREAGRSMAGVPLTVDGETTGVLLVSSRERRYEREDLLLLELVADRAARAIRQAELFESARSAAIELQRSLLPERLPLIDGLDVAVRYQPGQDGTEVGGDWYDLFPVPHGRVAIVVGDVVGRGLRAAARMGRVRTALRAYALESASPLETVQRLDRFVAAEEPLEFTTLIVVFLDPRTGAAAACTAGHLAPLIVGAAGTRLAPIANGPPIGVPDAGSRRESALHLEVGETLLAYTDGLVEDRAVGLDAGLRRLREVAVGRGSASDLVERVLAGMGARGGGSDDVAIVAVRRLGARMCHTFAAEPGAVAAARREVASFAAAHGAGPGLLRDLALAVSEACTNVVVHAYRDRAGTTLTPGPMHVAAEHRDALIEVTIADEGGGVRPREDSPGVGLGLQLIARTTADFEVRDVPGGGAQLVLRFAVPTMTT